MSCRRKTAGLLIKMKTRRLLCFFISFVVLLASCGGTEQPPNTSDLTETVPVSGEPTETVKEPDPMDDEELETTDEKNGYFYDSFTSEDGGLKWKPDNNSSVTYPGGTLKISTEYYDGDSSVERKSFLALGDNFKAEFRMKVTDEGKRVGFVCGMGDRRIFAFIYPDAMLIQTASGPLDEIVLPIYNDWHTYSFIADEGVVHFYFDGEYVVTFDPQKTGSAKMNFFASCVTSHPTVYLIDYVSYTPFSAGPVMLLDIDDGAVYDGNELTLTAKASADTAASGGEVSYYANGVKIGSSSKKGTAYSFDWENVSPGTYSLRAECGGVMSPPVLVTFGSAESSTPGVVRAAEYEVSSASELFTSYELDFLRDGDAAELTACDGFYGLDISWNGNVMTIAARDGSVTAEAGKGRYNILSDSGFCTVYYENNFLTDFFMPACKVSSLPGASGISDLTVEAYGKTYLSLKSETGKSGRELGDFGDCYALLFSADSGADSSISLFDGKYRTDIEIRDGSVFAWDNPKLTAGRRDLGNAPAGVHIWRLTVEGGIGRIWCDNNWFASLRLQPSSAGRYIVSTGTNEVRLTSLDERYYADISFTDRDASEYFDVCGDGWLIDDGKFSASGAVVATNNLFALDFSYEAKTDFSDKNSGYFYLLAAYTNEYSGLCAGYDFSGSEFKIISLTSKGKTVLASGKGSVSEKTVLKIVRSGKQVTLFADGDEKISAKYSDITPARAGFMTDGGAAVSRVSYRGDGFLQKSVSSQSVGGNVSPQIIEIGDKLYMTSGQKNTWESDDGGITWKTASGLDFSGFSNNMIATEDGKIVSICQTGSNRILKDVAKVSRDGGMTWTSYDLQALASYRITMNCKLVKSESGRLFFISGASGHAVEHSSIGEVYYSDNGTIWKKSQTDLSYRSTHMNLQENVIVDLGNGVLRMFARSDRGFLYFSDSHDNGITWETEFHPSVFASVESAFNIVRDYETGLLWMAWEYSCENDHGTVQYPRTRVALAVSRNGGTDWEYVSDIDETYFSACNHYNIGIAVTHESVFVTVVKVTPTQSGNELRNFVTRIDKTTASERTLLRFPGLDRYNAPENQSKWFENLLGRAIVVADGLAVIGGYEYTDIEYCGFDTYIPLSRIADVAGMTFSGSKDTFTLSLGNAKYTFNVGSDICGVKNGGGIKMSSPVLKSGGEPCITLRDTINLLNWQTAGDEWYSAAYYSPYPINFGFAVRNTHIQAVK